MDEPIYLGMFRNDTLIANSDVKITQYDFGKIRAHRKWYIHEAWAQSSDALKNIVFIRIVA